MDLSRKGINKFEALQDYEVLESTLNSFVDMTSPVGFSGFGSIEIDGNERFLHIYRNVEDPFTTSVTLQTISEEDTFEGGSLVVPQLWLDLDSQGIQVEQLENYTLLPNERISFYIERDRVLSITWYNPNVKLDRLRAASKPLS